MAMQNLLREMTNKDGYKFRIERSPIWSDMVIHIFKGRAENGVFFHLDSEEVRHLLKLFQELGYEVCRKED